ncbi:SUKH-4 family immunity protein [Kitasatospora cineracea]|uniref:SUKH-4 immunity protein of toxin-antitoxin system n=1 Tax=Kitasatospora cineracea TaxID=88074 RepID=A0A3N4RXA6_9ACTN|nr:SUKH-4 family immunity protein [Kitasatospora cineracea]RPE35701.1 SUKH-4 immunity protein of toxin-antitoxin system [Kitasatospora cineracea]
MTGLPDRIARSGGAAGCSAPLSGGRYSVPCMDDTRLDALTPACAGVLPYPGEWRRAPYEEREVDGARYHLVAVDPGVSAIGVRVGGGPVMVLSEEEEGEPGLLNSGPGQLLAFLELYREAAEEAERYEADEEPDESPAAAEELTDALLARFAAVDPAAVADENAYWCIAAEELGYGMEC